MRRGEKAQKQYCKVNEIAPTALENLAKSEKVTWNFCFTRCSDMQQTLEAKGTLTFTGKKD